MENTPKFFSKVTTNAHHELFIWANKKPLRWAVLMTISSRVASKDQLTTGLLKGEFFFSETEYEKFGLKISEKGNIRRILNELIMFKIVEKIENKTGNKNCTVYRFIDSDFIDCSRENREQNREQIENKERTDREQIETNKECKSIKNEKNDIVVEFEESYTSGIPVVDERGTSPCTLLNSTLLDANNEEEIVVVTQEAKAEKKSSSGMSFASFVEAMDNKNDIYDFMVERCKVAYKFDKFIIERELRKFYDYWTEQGEKDKKNRQQKEKSFEVNKRIGRWFEKVNLSQKDLEEIEKAKIARKLEQSQKLFNEQKNYE